MGENANENQAAKVDQDADQGVEKVAETSANESTQEPLTHLGETEVQATERISQEENNASKHYVTSALLRVENFKLS